ncbi:MAG: PAS domain S-box protein [Balneolales bacterium]
MQKSKLNQEQTPDREEIADLFEELRVDQANLEAQNKELRRAIKNKDHSLKKYTEQYDFAPVGYLSLDEEGRILEINLTGCDLLGEKRQRLINRPVTEYFDPFYKGTFEDHLKRVFSTGGSEVCQPKIKYKSGYYSVELRSIAVEDEETGRLYCRSSMFNLSGKLQVEAELEEQRKLMEAVFEHIESGIIVCNRDGILSFLNKAATKLFGPNQTGRGSDDWTQNLRLYQEDGKTILDKEEMPLYKAWNGEKVQNDEVNFSPDGGGKRTLLASGQPLYDQQGSNIGAVVALHDITDRKRAEDELKLYQEQLEKLVGERTAELKTANNQLNDEVTERSRLQKQYLTEKHFAESLINSQPGLFFLADNNGRIYRWNKNVEIYSGYSRDEIQNMTGWGLLDERDVEITRFRLDVALKTGKAVGKARLASKDGRKIPFLLTGVAYKLAGEDNVIVTGVDITAYEKERAEKMRFFQVLEKSKNEIYMFDADTDKLVYVNKGARENLGYTDSELMEMKCYELKPEVSEAAYHELVRPLLKKEQEKVILQTVLRRNDGSTYPVEVHFQLIEQEHEKVFIAIIWDITKRLKAEEQIRKALYEKEVLLGEIHHRVKNNLAIVSSLLTIQAGYVKDEKVKDLFIESESRVKSMAMIHEMLYRQESFSRIDFGPYIKKLINHISSNYKLSEITIQTNINIEDVSLEIGTAVPCALLINELFTNAYKHAFKGRKEGTISISLTSIDKVIKLTVEDDGVGLPPGIKRSNTLGMTLVNGLTAQLKGKIDIESVKGAKFKVSFPHSK